MKYGYVTYYEIMVCIYLFILDKLKNLSSSRDSFRKGSANSFFDSALTMCLKIKLTVKRFTKYYDDTMLDHSVGPSFRKS